MLALLWFVAHDINFNVLCGLRVAICIGYGNIGGSEFRWLNVLILGGTLISFSQTHRLDEIEPVLVKWLSGFLPWY